MLSAIRWPTPTMTTRRGGTCETPTALEQTDHGEADLTIVVQHLLLVVVHLGPAMAVTVRLPAELVVDPVLEPFLEGHVENCISVV